MSRRRAASAAVAIVVALATGACSSAPRAVPFSDPGAAGGLALCDASGHALTHGRVDTAPFVYRAVSAPAAPAGYSGIGRTATLYAFQPRRGVEPGYWSGGELTSASQYTDPAHPMVQLTRGDLPLAEFLSTYPVRWNHLVQLRIYLGAPGRPPHAAPYAATVLRITGGTWTVVTPASVSCTSGSATSLETELLPGATP